MLFITPPLHDGFGNEADVLFEVTKTCVSNVVVVCMPKASGRTVWLKSEGDRISRDVRTYVMYGYIDVRE